MFSLSIIFMMSRLPSHAKSISLRSLCQILAQSVEIYQFYDQNKIESLKLSPRLWLVKLKDAKLAELQLKSTNGTVGLVGQIAYIRIYFFRVSFGLKI